MMNAGQSLAAATVNAAAARASAPHPGSRHSTRYASTVNRAPSTSGMASTSGCPPKCSTIGMAAKHAAAVIATRSPDPRRTRRYRTRTDRTVAIEVGRRACHSPAPNIRYSGAINSGTSGG